MNSCMVPFTGLNDDIRRLCHASKRCSPPAFLILIWLSGRTAVGDAGTLKKHLQIQDHTDADVWAFLAAHTRLDDRLQ